MKKIVLSALHYLGILVLVIAVSGCEHQFSSKSASQKQFTLFPHSAEYYLKEAKKAKTPQKQNYLLLASGRLIQDHRLKPAESILDKLTTRSLTHLQQQKKQIIESKLALANNQPQMALATLSGIFNPEQLPLNWRIEFHQILAMAYARNGNGLNSVRERIKLQTLLPPSDRAQNTKQLWETLNQYDIQTLDELLVEEPKGTMRGWIELTIIYKRYNNSPQQQIELQKWQTRYPNHAGNALIADLIKNPAPVTPEKKPGQIALLLPLSGPLAKPGEAVKNGFMAAKDASFSTTNVTVYDTSNNQVLSAYQKAINDGAQVIVGPLDKNSVQTLANHGELSVPTIALNTINGSENNLYQFGLSPQEEAIFIANKAKSDGYHRALVLSPKGAWGESIAQSFISAWEHQGGQIIAKATFSSWQTLAPTIKTLLQVKTEGKKKKFVARRHDADMIFIVASPTQARQMLPILKFYFANDLPTYSTSLAYSSLNDPEADRDLDGLIFCDMPWVFGSGAKVEAEYVAVNGLWPESWNTYTRLYALGYDAYQLALSKDSMSNSFFKLDGQTGELQIDKRHKIYRQLKCAKMQNGTPQTLSFF